MGDKGFPNDAPPPLARDLFQLHRRADSDFELGAFRAWAGYKDLGVDAATGGRAHLQHVLSFGPSEVGGRTGIHCHLAEGHLVIPTSGRGVFSYDGVVTEARPGQVIVQHGGTVHDQFHYSYAASSAADNRLTPQWIEPAAEAAGRSFGFLELFIPKTLAHVEIVPPAEVSEADQASAWRHPFHARGAHFALQQADAPSAIYRALEGRPDLEVRDGGTWEPSGGMFATWFIRPASRPSAETARLEIPGQSDGVAVLYMISGSASFVEPNGGSPRLEAGDTLVCGQDLAQPPLDPTTDMRLVWLFLSEKALETTPRTQLAVERLEALGSGIVTAREVRPAGDRRPVNFLQEQA